MGVTVTRITSADSPTRATRIISPLAYVWVNTAPTSCCLAVAMATGHIAISAQTILCILMERLSLGSLALSVCAIHIKFFNFAAEECKRSRGRYPCPGIADNRAASNIGSDGSTHARAGGQVFVMSDSSNLCHLKFTPLTMERSSSICIGLNHAPSNKDSSYVRACAQQRRATSGI